MIESIPFDDGTLSVDLFEDPAGGFGFEHMRSDPEDGGRWTIVGGFSSARYDSALHAALAARTAVPWSNDDRAIQGWNRWCSHCNRSSHHPGGVVTLTLRAFPTP